MNSKHNNLDFGHNLMVGQAYINTISKYKSEVVISPLEQGFGLTLGNALRRILLSCLPGCAVTGVKIEGVLHEYSTIPGVKEDMIEIVLNLKKVVAKPLQSQNKEVVRVSHTGPRALLAKHFTTDNVIIENPEHVICTLAESASINMELTFSNGREMYNAKEQKNIGDNEIGKILINSVFNPIKLISIHVEDARVGQKIGYDKLLMNIETNGSVDVKSALDFAAKVLKTQLDALIFFEDQKYISKSEKKADLPFDPILLRKVNTLDLSVRSNNCMQNIGIVYIGDLVVKNESDILKTPNFGRKSLNEIKQSLKELNLSLSMSVPGWPPKEDIETMQLEYSQTQSNL